MNEFWKLFKESYIIQGTVTLLMVGVILYLYVTNKPVPNELVNFVALILGFYFGSKSQQIISKG